MVSPRRTTDVENRLGLGGIQSNPLNLKNQNLLKPPAVPLGDVRNTLGATRQLFKTSKDDATSSKGSELKPLKVEATPAQATPAEEFDPVWDAPLAWEHNTEDSYHDIIPPEFQLSEEAWDRLVFNCPGSRSGKPLDESSDAEDPEFNLSMSFDDDMSAVLGHFARLDDDVDIPVVECEDYFAETSYMSAVY